MSSSGWPARSGKWGIDWKTWGFSLFRGRDLLRSDTPIYERCLLTNECKRRRRVADTHCAFGRQLPKVGLDKIASARYLDRNAALLTFCQFATRHWLISVARRRCPTIETEIGRTHGCGLASRIAVVNTDWEAVYASFVRSGPTVHLPRQQIEPSASFAKFGLPSCGDRVRGVYLFVVVPLAGTPAIDKQGKRPSIIADRGIRTHAYPSFFYGRPAARLDAAA